MTAVVIDKAEGAQGFIIISYFDLKTLDKTTKVSVTAAGVSEAELPADCLRCCLSPGRVLAVLVLSVILAL